MNKPLEFHEAAAAFPLMPGEQLSALVESIRTNGLRQPIVLHEGKVLDGRNRLRACEAAGVPPAFSEYDGDPWAYAWDANGERRDLTAAQRAAIRLRIDRGSAAWHEARRQAQARANEKRSQAAKDRRRHVDGTLAPSRVSSDTRLDERDRLRTKLAAESGVSEATAGRVQALAGKRPDLLERVADGEMKLANAMREARKGEVEQRVTALPADVYRVIYADPPWSYGNSGAIADSDHYARVERHYPSMPTGDICALPVREMTASDAVLFLWVTSPLLPDGLRVMSAWGFAYKSSFVWHKLKHNFGHYNSMRHEFLLVGTRGSCTPDADKLEPSVVEVPRGAHSTKPAEFREMIDRMYPHGPRIEMFARGDIPAPWKAWGNEA